MEKIDNIQKEEIAGDPTLKEVPSESEYETETDDEVFLWERHWFNDVYILDRYSPVPKIGLT